MLLCGALRTGRRKDGSRLGLLLPLLSLKDSSLLQVLFRCLSPIKHSSTKPNLQNLGVRVWDFDSGQLLAVHGDTAYYESLVLSGGRQIFARGLLCERLVLPVSPNSRSENDEIVLESQRWLAFSPLMAANTTKLVRNYVNATLTVCRYQEYSFHFLSGCRPGRVICSGSRRVRFCEQP